MLSIPPDHLRRSVPPLHKGGFFAQANTTGKESMPGRYFAYKLRFNRYLPAKPKPQGLLRLWGFYDRVREHCLAVPTRDPSASFASGGSPLAGGLIHYRLGHHLMNGGRQPGEDAGGEIARMMV